MSDQYILLNKKCIDFYKKNPHLDFNEINELFIDLIQNISSNNRLFLEIPSTILRTVQTGNRLKFLWTNRSFI